MQQLDAQLQKVSCCVHLLWASDCLGQDGTKYSQLFSGSGNMFCDQPNKGVYPPSFFHPLLRTHSRRIECPSDMTMDQQLCLWLKSVNLLPSLFSIGREGTVGSVKKP